MSEPALVLRRNAQGQLRVQGNPPKTHTVTADQFARFITAGCVVGDAVVLDGTDGGQVSYKVAVDDESGEINLTLETKKGK